MSERKQDPQQIIDASFIGAVGVALDAGRDEAASGHARLPPPVMAEIAFAGRSNVGKSSLINTLVDRRGLVRTSSTPGSTRQINIFEARARDGAVFHLVDLPGYGFTRRSKAEQALWAALIEGYLRERVTLAAVVLLVDARRGLQPDDIELIQYIESTRNPARRPVQVILVATKIDKLPRSSRKSVLQKLARGAASSKKPRIGTGPAGGKGDLQPPRSVGSSQPPPSPSSRAASAHSQAPPGLARAILGFSSVTGEGKRELWAFIRRATLGVAPDVPPPAPSDPGRETEMETEAETETETATEAEAPVDSIPPPSDPGDEDQDG